MITASTSVAQFDNPAASLVGLTTQKAQALLSEYGPNDPKPIVRGALAFELLRLFLNPLVIILLVASVISGFLGQKIDAEIIFIIVLLSVTIDFLQTYRSHRAIERLREHVSLTATVLRDGQWQEIKRQDVVPGDIVRLSAGDLVPADGQLLEARDLYVQQAGMLLGPMAFPLYQSPWHCHQRQDRSFFIRGPQVPLCSRCTCVAESVMNTPIRAADTVQPQWLFGLRTSTNFFRFVTGIVFSMAMLSLAFGAAKWLWSITL